MDIQFGMMVLYAHDLQKWNTLTSAGHHGRTAPAHIDGPYAAMVDDPDGNVVLISSDLATLTGTTTT